MVCSMLYRKHNFLCLAKRLYLRLVTVSFDVGKHDSITLIGDIYVQHKYVICDLLTYFESNNFCYFIYFILGVHDLRNPIVSCCFELQICIHRANFLFEFLHQVAYFSQPDGRVVFGRAVTETETANNKSTMERNNVSKDLK